MSKNPTGSATNRAVVNKWLFFLPLFLFLLAIANLLTLGIFIGAPLFLLGDAVPRLILPPFHNERFMTIAIFMGSAWSLGASVISLAYVLHNGAKDWSGRKILSFAFVLVALDVGLSVYFHVDAVSEDSLSRAPESDLVLPAGRGNLETVKALIAGGAKVNERKSCLDSPLIAAASGGHAQVVKVLLEAGARVDFRGSCQMPESMLCMAAIGGNLEVVRMLLKNGALLNDFDSSGRTPLMCASSVGNLEVMKFLLENGADIHAVGRSSVTSPEPIDTALMHAAMRGRPQATQLLLERGARVDEKGRYGLTALAYAVRGRDEFQGNRGVSPQDYPGTVRILLQHGAAPSVKDNQGQTALQLARTLKSHEIVELLEAGPSTK